MIETLILFVRLSYNKIAADCAGALFYAMMKYAVDMPHSSAGELSSVFLLSHDDLINLSCSFFLLLTLVKYVGCFVFLVLLSD